MCDFCQLYYDSHDNLIKDDMGFIVFGIFDYITPNQFFLFKLKRADMIVESRYGQLVEIIYEK